jgi:hypothetical protein
MEIARGIKARSVKQDVFIQKQGRIRKIREEIIFSRGSAQPVSPRGQRDMVIENRRVHALAERCRIHH